MVGTGTIFGRFLFAGLMVFDAVLRVVEDTGVWTHDVRDTEIVMFPRDGCDATSIGQRPYDRVQAVGDCMWGVGSPLPETEVLVQIG